MSEERQHPGSTHPVGARNGDARRNAATDLPTPPSGLVNEDHHSWQPGDSPRVNTIALARFGMVLVIVVEAMTFAGLISAFLSIRASLDFWPPLDQPRFPVIATAINTAVLLVSGATMFLFMTKYRKPDTSTATLTTLLVLTLALGGLFVGLQGIEWARLIGYGLTVTSSSYGSIFYVLIGFHAIHVLTAVLCLALVTASALRRQFPPEDGQHGSGIDLLVFRRLGLAGLVWSGLLLAWRYSLEPSPPTEGWWETRLDCGRQ